MNYLLKIIISVSLINLFLSGFSQTPEKRTYKKPYEMEQTFEQMKDAAKEVHRRFYKYCTSSFNDIVNTDNVRDLRRVVIRYRDYVSDPRAARYIRENYADVLEALGLRIQFYIDGRVRLYLAN